MGRETQPKPAIVKRNHPFDCVQDKSEVLKATVLAEIRSEHFRDLRHPKLELG